MMLKKDVSAIHKGNVYAVISWRLRRSFSTGLFECLLLKAKTWKYDIYLHDFFLFFVQWILKGILHCCLLSVRCCKAYIHFCLLNSCSSLEVLAVALSSALGRALFLSQTGPCWHPSVVRCYWIVCQLWAEFHVSQLSLDTVVMREICWPMWFVSLVYLYGINEF